MSARQPFVPKRSETGTDPIHNPNQNQNTAEAIAQSSANVQSRTSINDKDLNISGLIKSKSSKKKDSQCNDDTVTLKPLGSLGHIQRPIPPQKSTKPILEALALNNRQNRLNLNKSILSSSSDDVNSGKSLLFKIPSNNNGFAQESPSAIASPMPQENAISAPKFNFAARPHLLADGNGNNPHIRTSTSASSPDPFVQDSNSGQTGQNSTDLGPGNLAQPAPGVAFGFGVSADAQGSPSFALANKIGTDKRARIEDDEHTDKANDGKRGARKRRKEDTIHDNISSAFLPHGSNQHYYQNTPDRMMYDSSRDFAESQQHMD
ncbi:hypothetical protein HWV62_4525, partial [Athelia sp. TMB]